MAVFPDRIVHKSSSGTDAEIRALIGIGGTDEIQQGEIVVSTNDANPSLYIKDASGAIQKIGAGGGGDGGGGGGGASVIVDEEEPTERADGTAFQEGDVWFNPQTGILSVYTYPTRSYDFTYQGQADSVGLLWDADLGPKMVGSMNDDRYQPEGYDDSFYEYEAYYSFLDSTGRDFTNFWEYPSSPNPPRAFWVSENGSSWRAGTGRRGFSNPAYSWIMPLYSDDLDLRGLNGTWRFLFEDPANIGWQPVGSEQMVRSVQGKQGFVRLNLAEMDDVERTILDPRKPDYTAGFISSSVTFPENSFTMGSDSFLDYAEVPEDIPPDVSQWTIYADDARQEGYLVVSDSPETEIGYGRFQSLPDYDSSQEWYADLTIFGLRPDASGQYVENYSKRVRTFYDISWTKSLEDFTNVLGEVIPDSNRGRWILTWPLEQFDPRTEWWGYEEGSQATPGTVWPVDQLRISVTFGTELYTTGPVDGGVLTYVEEEDKYFVEKPITTVLGMDDVTSGVNFDINDLPGLFKFKQDPSFNLMNGFNDGYASTDNPTDTTLDTLIIYRNDIDGKDWQEYVLKFIGGYSNFKRVWYSRDSGQSWGEIEIEMQAYSSSMSRWVFRSGNWISLDEQDAEIWFAMQSPYVISPKDGQALIWSDDERSFIPTTITTEAPPLSLDDLTDVDVSTALPTNNQALAYDANTGLWRPYTVSAVGSGNALIAQAAYEQQTTDVDGKATFELLGFWGNLTKIECDQAAWVTLYATDTARTSDLSRPFGTMPVPGSGVLAAFNLGANTPFVATPPMPYFNGEPTSLNEIYALARQQDGTVIESVIISINAYSSKLFDTISGGTFSGA